jgi:regulator of cell morphogenesis and NO signaling
MKVTERTPVGDIVAKYPRAAHVFEAHRIDYCCGGDHPLTEACDAAGATPQVVLNEILRAVAEPLADRDWTADTLAELIAHIVDVHHGYLRAELPILANRLQKVLAAHGERHGASLSALSAAFDELHRDLGPHLEKEERILFPAILRCEQAAVEPGGAPAGAAGLRRPIAVMQQEHQAAGRALNEMRTCADDYTVPADGCATYRALFDGLVRLEADLHRHIHLENNILFPRVIGLGAALD